MFAYVCVYVHVCVCVMSVCVCMCVCVFYSSLAHLIMNKLLQKS